MCYYTCHFSCICGHPRVPKEQTCSFHFFRAPSRVSTCVGGERLAGAWRPALPGAHGTFAPSTAFSQGQGADTGANCTGLTCLSAGSSSGLTVGRCCGEPCRKGRRERSGHVSVQLLPRGTTEAVAGSAVLSGSPWAVDPALPGFCDGNS